MEAGCNKEPCPRKSVLKKKEERFYIKTSDYAKSDNNYLHSIIESKDTKNLGIQTFTCEIFPCKFYDEKLKQ
jgi:hypothetical protein